MIIIIIIFFFCQRIATVATFWVSPAENLFIIVMHCANQSFAASSSADLGHNLPVNLHPSEKCSAETKATQQRERGIKPPNAAPSLGMILLWPLESTKQQEAQGDEEASAEIQGSPLCKKKIKKKWTNSRQPRQRQQKAIWIFKTQSQALPLVNVQEAKQSSEGPLGKLGVIVASKHYIQLMSPRIRAPLKPRVWWPDITKLHHCQAAGLRAASFT